MRLDDEYTSIDVCPETGERIYETHSNDGVCPHCGNVAYLIIHHDQIAGRWNRASLFERLFQGKKTEFFTKEDEDKVWGGLQK